MKNNRLILLIPCLLMVSGCAKEQPNTKTKIETPKLSIAADNSKIVWNEIEGAVSYLVKDNDEEPVSVSQDTLQVDFSSVIGDHSIAVKAIAEVEERSSR